MLDPVEDVRSCPASLLPHDFVVPEGQLQLLDDLVLVEVPSIGGPDLLELTLQALVLSPERVGDPMQGRELSLVLALDLGMSGAFELGAERCLKAFPLRSQLLPLLRI